MQTSIINLEKLVKLCAMHAFSASINKNLYLLSYAGADPENFL